MLPTIRQRVSDWIVGLFVKAIDAIQAPDKKVEVLNWLIAARSTISSSQSNRATFVALYKSLDARVVVLSVFGSVAGAAKAYLKADLPLAAKLAIPVTVLAMPFVSGQGAGIAAFGTAIGVPILLLIFIGTAGMTSVIEACATNTTARAYTKFVLGRIAQDEAFRAFRAAMRAGEQGEQEAPMRADMPPEASLRRATLFAMDPITFEQHVMSFFVGPGLKDAAITRQGSDKGIDGVRAPSRWPRRSAMQAVRINELGRWSSLARFFRRDDLPQSVARLFRDNVRVYPRCPRDRRAARRHHPRRNGRPCRMA